MKSKKCYETHKSCNGTSCNYDKSEVKPSYTPGPWRISDDGQHIGNGYDFDVALVLVGDNKLEDEANARLIAAAPQLVEALEQTLSELRRAYEFLDSHDQMSDVIKAGRLAVIQRAQAALKAAGAEI